MDHDTRICKCCIKDQEHTQKLLRMLQDSNDREQALRLQLSEINTLLAVTIRHAQVQEA